MATLEGIKIGNETYDFPKTDAYVKTESDAKYATKTEMSQKQDALTAGDNITIQNGVISASGGGVGDLPISKETATDRKQEIVIGKAKNDPTIIIDEDRVKVKEITDLEGNPISGVNSSNYLYDKKILAVGDSMVAGHSITDASGNTWLAKIATRNGMTRYNKGTNGAFMTKRVYSGTSDNSVYSKVCESDTSMYISDEIMQSLDYIIIYAGTNDCANSVTIGETTSGDVTEFCGALNAICQTLQTRAPQARIGFITPQLRNGIESRCWNYINAVVNVCKKYSIPVYNQGDNCGVCWSNSAIRTTHTLDDSYHLNVFGMNWISYKYEQFLRSI